MAAPMNITAPTEEPNCWEQTHGLLVGVFGLDITQCIFTFASESVLVQLGGWYFETRSGGVRSGRARYTSKSNSWSLNNIEITLPPIDRRNMFVVAADDLLLVVGGELFLENYESTTEILAWRLGEDSWSVFAELPEPLTKAQCCCSNNVLYVVGGERADLSCSNNVYALDLTTREWAELPPMAHPRKNCACAYVKGDLIVASGSNPEEYLTHSESYNIHTQTWTELPPLDKPMSRSGFCRWQDGLVVVGGLTANMALSVTKRVRFFDGTQWRKLKSIPKPVVNSCVGIVSGKLTVTGGTNMLQPAVAKTSQVPEEVLSLDESEWVSVGQYTGTKGAGYGWLQAWI